MRNTIPTSVASFGDELLYHGAAAYWKLTEEQQIVDFTQGVPVNKDSAGGF